MKVIIKGTENETAGLVLALQNRQIADNTESETGKIKRWIREAINDISEEAQSKN